MTKVNGRFVQTKFGNIGIVECDENKDYMKNSKGSYNVHLLWSPCSYTYCMQDAYFEPEKEFIGEPKNRLNSYSWHNESTYFKLTNIVKNVYPIKKLPKKARIAFKDAYKNKFSKITF